MQHSITTSTIQSLKKRRKARGSFITEFMGTWGLYALIGAIALAALGTAYIIFWGTSETENVSRLYSATLPLKSSRGGYGAEANLVPVLVATDSVPRSMNITETGGSAVIKNNWGGDVNVVSSADGQQFIITLNGVPANQCAKMIQTLSNSGAFSLIEVNDTTVGTLPVTIAIASTSCDGGGAKKIAFTSVN